MPPSGKRTTASARAAPARPQRAGPRTLVKQIAGILGIEIGAVKVRVHRAVRELREIDQGERLQRTRLRSVATTAETERRSGRPARIQIERSTTGTINGGGAEFELRTFNGNIYVRRAP